MYREEVIAGETSPRFSSAAAGPLLGQAGAVLQACGNTLQKEPFVGWHAESLGEGRAPLASQPPAPSKRHTQA